MLLRKSMTKSCKMSIVDKRNCVKRPLSITRNRIKFNASSWYCREYSRYSIAAVYSWNTAVMSAVAQNSSHLYLVRWQEYLVWPCADSCMRRAVEYGLFMRLSLDQSFFSGLCSGHLLSHCSVPIILLANSGDNNRSNSPTPRCFGSDKSTHRQTSVRQIEPKQSRSGIIVTYDQS